MASTAGSGPLSDGGEREPPTASPSKASGYPPYPSAPPHRAPPSVADTIVTGRDLRYKHKNVLRPSVKPPPIPAKPRSPKATDVKLSRRAMKAHARCLRKHGAVLTDRLQAMSKPARRQIICLWRERADVLPPETITRLRSMLDADEPFKPEQAYEYFTNIRKTKKKVAASRRVNEIKKDILRLGDTRSRWARNATVAFAKGIQQRLARPGRYALADGMRRLSDIVLEEICEYMQTKMPSRCCTHPKAKFLVEMADKIAICIDEILEEAEDRMLMMDLDEDEEVARLMAESSDPELTTQYLGKDMSASQSAASTFSGADSLSAKSSKTSKAESVTSKDSKPESVASKDSNPESVAPKDSKSESLAPKDSNAESVKPKE